MSTPNISDTPAKKPETILWLAGAAYAALYLILFPSIYSTMDESAYLATAYALLHHTVYIDVVGVSAVFAFPVGPHQISMYPPGMPALLTLGGIIGWKAVMGINLLTHLGAFAVVAATLRRLKLPTWYSLLYLLHPTAVIYSRTVMSDVPTGLLIGSAFLLYLKRQRVGAGALMGIALLVRSASLVGGPLLCLGCLLDTAERESSGSSGDGKPAPRLLDRTDLLRRIGDAVRIGLGWLPFFAFAYYYQAKLQDGGWHKFPLLKLSAFPHGVKTYGLYLLLCYPLMLFAPLLFRRYGKAALNCVVFGFLLLYCCYEFTDTASGKAQAFVVGQRYLLTILPLLIVAYAGMITDFVAARVPLPLRRAGAIGAVALMVALTIGVHYQHTQFLNRNRAVQESLLETIPANALLVCTGQTGKFFSPGWGGPRTFELYTSATPQDIHRSLAAGRPVMYAQWFRERLSDLNREADPTALMQRDFVLRPLSAAERHGLPDDVVVYQVEARSTSNL